MKKPRQIHQDLKLLTDLVFEAFYYDPYNTPRGKQKRLDAALKKHTRALTRIIHYTTGVRYAKS